MAIVKGKIDSLKRIRAELNQEGITRFNSLGDLQSFLKSYETERESILNHAADELESEIVVLQEDSMKYEALYNDLKIVEQQNLIAKIEALSNKHQELQSTNQSGIQMVFNTIQQKLVQFKKVRLERNFENIIQKRTSTVYQQLTLTNKKLYKYTSFKEQVIQERTASKTKKLDTTKEVVDRLYPLIAGAIGENLVEKEIGKLSDEYILFNDYSLQFDTPIINKKTNDKIFSIQIDHLVLSKAGIFLIETKNWSKNSVENLDFRSPIDQIKRTSYALFVLLNRNTSDSTLSLSKHHWGAKKIPIRNVIVMINNKPKEEFKFVAVKALDELNDYITYFDPVFDEEDVQEIAVYLDGIRN